MNVGLKVTAAGRSASRGRSRSVRPASFGCPPRLHAATPRLRSRRSKCARITTAPGRAISSTSMTAWWRWLIRWTAPSPPMRIRTARRCRPPAYRSDFIRGVWSACPAALQLFPRTAARASRLPATKRLGRANITPAMQPTGSRRWCGPLAASHSGRSGDRALCRSAPSGLLRRKRARA
jgi:hypothetical protein